MRAVAVRIRQKLTLDQLGMTLSFLCAIHCALTPIALLFLPMVVGKAFENPLFHWILAVLIVPIGLKAFQTGFRHHKNIHVFYFGIPGLMIVGILPLLLPGNFNPWGEAALMIVGSALLITAHWLNRKSCACEIHGAS